MTDWNTRFISLAEIIGSWSKDPSKKIGAIVVDKDNRIVSTGFNGFARGVADIKESLENKDVKRLLMLHAEENAILYAKQDLSGCRIYIAGLPPCVHCASMIIQSGIKEVYFKNLDPNKKVSEFWQSNLKLATEILTKAGVKIIEL